MSIFCHTLYLDWIKEHHSIKVRVYSIDQHDYDVNDAKIVNIMFNNEEENRLFFTLRLVFLSVMYEQKVQT